MSTSVDSDDGYSENTCVVCFKHVDIFSIGDCDHPVCYECSTRMRVLCRQNECPICRHDMQKVIFTKAVRSFKILDETIGIKHLIDRKFKIVFENNEVQHAYNTLLAHVCFKCPGRRAFQTFNILRDHMRKEHELFYCDLCVDNLKILTHERQCYTRKELATHRRQGDADNRSHRGHPLCEFCDRRYMDNDELYRHLRREHLYCHFCDADGLHQYYDSYDVLRNHFREQHFLCEEGDCYEDKFTPAFRTEIDLKAHRASVHGRHMTKAAAKQARTLELAFTLKPRPRQTEQRRGGRPNSRYHSYSDEEEGAVGGVVDHHHTSQQQPPPTFSRLDMASNDQFPSLGGSGNMPATLQGLSFRKPGRVAGGRTIRDEDFPALGPEATVSLRVNSVSTADRIKGPSNVSIRVNHQPNAVITTVSSAKNTQLDRDPFPALQNNSASLFSRSSSNMAKPSSTQWSTRVESEPKSSIRNRSSHSAPKQSQSKNSKPYLSDDDSFNRHNDFPSLNGNIPSHISSLAAAQWSLGKEPEPKLTINKNRLTQPPPKPPQPKTFHIEDDFPSLNSRFDASCGFSEHKPQVCDPKLKKESSISISVSENNWTRPLSDNISSDSDIGSKKSIKKKKNKSKTQKDLANEPAEPPNKSVNINNNEPGKKSKQKDESKSKPKQTKNEEKGKKQPSEQESLQNKKSTHTLERKRSELTIESFNSQSNSEINSYNFPNLGSDKDNTSSQTPPGFTSVMKDKSTATAPPGFENKSKPPPGFSITLNSVARPNNALTFTSSSGQNYPISPGNKKESTRVFLYVAPPNVKQRNSSLVEQVRAALGSAEALSEFLQMSALFRQGSLPADTYYTHCHRAITPDTFSHIFPELLVLLPDIDKQQELWKVADKKKWRLNECAVCGQVVAAADFKHHHNTHSLENHFPSLPNGVSESNVWTKK